jgi:hypothetical protein
LLQALITTISIDKARTIAKNRLNDLFILFSP